MGVMNGSKFSRPGKIGHLIMKISGVFQYLGSMDKKIASPVLIPEIEAPLLTLIIKRGARLQGQHIAGQVWQL